MSDVKFEKVEKRYGAHIAVRDFDLDVRPGEFLTLLGPSGCGKTTCLRMVAGFIAPSSGRILMAGSDVTALPAYRRNTGMVFQSYSLFPHMTVAENVGFPLRMRTRLRRDAARKRIVEMLELVQLADFGTRYPRQLSGGQQQRVAMARALVSRPRLLLMDEPLGALDKKLRESTQLELMELQRRLGMTFIIVTHDQEEAMTVADRIGVMDNGRLEQVATPRKLYEAPNSRWVAEFVGDINLFEGQAEPGDGGRLAVATKDAGTIIVAAPPTPPDTGASRKSNSAFCAPA